MFMSLCYFVYFMFLLLIFQNLNPGLSDCFTRCGDWKVIRDNQNNSFCCQLLYSRPLKCSILLNAPLKTCNPLILALFEITYHLVTWFRHRSSSPRFSSSRSVTFCNILLMIGRPPSVSTHQAQQRWPPASQALTMYTRCRQLLVYALWHVLEVFVDTF